MDITHFPSKLLEDAVNEFSKLPGIGKKTALRLVLYLLKQDIEDVKIFGNSMIQLREHVKRCKLCNNISLVCSHIYSAHDGSKFGGCRSQCILLHCLDNS